MLYPNFLLCCIQIFSYDVTCYIKQIHPPHILHTRKEGRRAETNPKGWFMNQVHIALGTPEKFIKLGDFNVTVKGNAMDAYYNVDLGDHRARMFDVNSATYKNLEKAHQSFHHSGQSHMKVGPGRHKVFVGHISDGSALNDLEMNPLILGMESFFFDVAAMAGICEPDTLFLNPPNGATKYSILWLWVPATDPQKIHHRWFHVNLWGSHSGYDTFQTAGLGDLAITCDMKTVLTVNGWEIRALFLKPLLPVMTHGVVLCHPKGIEEAWRAYVFLDAHFPLSQMLNLEATRRRPVLITEPYQIPAKARTPWALVKQKEEADGADSSHNGS